MQMLESDLERAGKFVALQVEDIKLRSRALAARAAAASTPAELDRIEGRDIASMRYACAMRAADAHIAPSSCCGRRRGGSGAPRSLHPVKLCWLRQDREEA
jgi:hypothetical protein